jgi:hypothetical protein
MMAEQLSGYGIDAMLTPNAHDVARGVKRV